MISINRLQAILKREPKFKNLPLKYEYRVPCNIFFIQINKSIDRQTPKDFPVKASLIACQISEKVLMLPLRFP